MSTINRFIKSQSLKELVRSLNNKGRYIAPIKEEPPKLLEMVIEMGVAELMIKSERVHRFNKQTQPLRKYI